MILPEPPAGGNTRSVGGGQSCPAGGADGVAPAGVLVFGGDVPEALVEPDGVVDRADPVQLGLELAAVGDPFQVRVLGLDVPEQGFDPGLVVGGGGTAEVLPDPDRGQERRGRLGGHLRPVVTDRQQPVSYTHLTL